MGESFSGGGGRGAGKIKDEEFPHLQTGSKCGVDLHPGPDHFHLTDPQSHGAYDPTSRGTVGLSRYRFTFCEEM